MKGGPYFICMKEYSLIIIIIRKHNKENALKCPSGKIQPATDICKSDRLP